MRLRAMTEHLLRIAQFICSRSIVIGQKSTSLHASDIDTSLAWQTAQLLCLVSPFSSERIVVRRSAEVSASGRSVAFIGHFQGLGYGNIWKRLKLWTWYLYSRKLTSGTAHAGPPNVHMWVFDREHEPIDA